MAKRKHISTGEVYIKTACGRFVLVDADGNRWAHSPGERNVCRPCQAAKTRQTRDLLTNLLEWQPESERPIPLSLDADGGIVAGHSEPTEDSPWGW